MIKGKWIILSVLALAVLMSLASWPLMRLRRKNEIYKTEKTIEQLRASCHAYKAKHGDFPKKLADLDPVRGEPFDAWGRPFKYNPLWKYGLPSSAVGPNAKDFLPEIHSLGPDEEDPKDDIPAPRPSPSEGASPDAPKSQGSSKMD